MNDLVFRIAKEADEQAILDFYESVRKSGRESGTCDWADDYPSKEILADDIKNRRLWLSEIFSESSEKKIAGTFSILETDDLDDEPLPWTAIKSCVPARIAVAPEMQGKGFGKLLLREIIAIAKKSGFQSLRLLASKKNDRANRLYQSALFVLKGEARLYGGEYIAYEYLIKAN